MPRLFIAIEVPPDQAATLLRLLPRHRAIRPTAAAQLHLTLRFLGEQDEAATARITELLRTVAVPSLALQVEGAGRFRGRQGAILWAGLAASPPLVDLFEAIGAVLETEGIAPERRRFWPHLTLARCRPGVPESLLHEWLTSHRALTLPEWDAGQFALYESVLHAQGARHAVRQVYARATPDC